MVDIVEQKETSETLKKERDFIAAVLSTAGMLVVVLDRDGRIVRFNRACERLTGYSFEEIKGKPFWDLFLIPEEVEPVKAVFADLRAGQFPNEHENFWVTKDGGRRLIKWSNTSLLDIEGSVDYVIGTGVDITEQRRGEEEIKTLNERLKQRTLELEGVNRELEAFSYSVSHDLQNQVLAVDGLARLLLERYSEHIDEKGRQLLKLARTNVQNMQQLIKDLLAFSHMGYQEVTLSQIDMAALAESVLEQLKLVHPGRSMKFTLRDLPPALGNEPMIRQVFVNLLGNAIKFTRPRTTAMIEIGGTVKNDEHIYFVRDNGVGFEMRHAKKIFGIFQRLHCREDFEGTGVGLAIVQRIIGEHGGKVWADAKPDEGATFYFALPKQKPEVPKKPMAATGRTMREGLSKERKGSIVKENLHFGKDGDLDRLPIL